MSLVLPPSPDGTRSMIANGLKRAHASGRLTLPGSTGGSVIVTPVAPHRVYSIGFDHLLDNRGLKAAQPAGWRAIVLQGKEAVAAVDFKGIPGDPHNFKSVNQGPFVQATAVAVAVAEGLPQVKAKNYELRLLQIPSINLVTLWLHSEAEQLFIPLDPAPRRFKPYNLYSEDQLFALAGALAVRRSRFAAPPSGHSPPPAG